MGRGREIEIPLSSGARAYKPAELFIASDVRYDPTGYFLSFDEEKQLRAHCGGMPFRIWNAHEGIVNQTDGVFIESRTGDVEKTLKEAGLTRETDQRVTCF